jgi:hypothetical protein
MANVKTSKLGNTGVDYAKVPDRLKQFREEHPKASIETKPTFNEDGSLFFSAKIVSDKSDESSPEATGTAYYNKTELNKTKAFEKLETISVGRALALLGYLNSGEVATTEEMEEFNEYRQQKIDDAIALINDCDNLDQLKTVFLSLDNKANPKIITAKDLKKLELQKVAK